MKPQADFDILLYPPTLLQMIFNWPLSVTSTWPLNNLSMTSTKSLWPLYDLHEISLTSLWPPWKSLWPLHDCLLASFTSCSLCFRLLALNLCHDLGDLVCFVRLDAAWGRGHRYQVQAPGASSSWQQRGQLPGKSVSILYIYTIFSGFSTWF